MERDLCGTGHIHPAPRGSGCTNGEGFMIKKGKDEDARRRYIP